MEAIKVFLVEDEYVIRNGIKNSIEWAREGYAFAGEAADGELAFPLIINTKPDILITDIKMPFMDGLELSQLVKKELPDIKIIILSGYDEFEYAKEAIGIGVSDYLLKPVSAEKLLHVIGSTREAILKEREERLLMETYQKEMRENTEHAKYKLVTQILSQPPAMPEILDESRRLCMELGAVCYNIMLFKISGEGEEDDVKVQIMESFEETEKLLHGLKQVEFCRRGVEGWFIICMGEDREQLKENVELCRARLREMMTAFPALSYFGGIGCQVGRIRELKRSFREAEKAFANRFTCQESRIVSLQEIQTANEQEEPDVGGFGMVEQNRQLITRFLRSGTEEEVDSFVEAYFDRIPEGNIKSTLMRQYLIMDIYIHVNSFGEGLSIPEEKIRESCGDIKNISRDIKDQDDMKEYVRKLTGRMLELRDEASGRRYTDIIARAREYIDTHYTSEEISLNSVSYSVNMSPSYFSSIFSQETGQTFVEYLTQVRMEKARELLMCSSMKTSEIGYEVGYKDAHYFSYLFKKTQGITPKEYRQRRNGGK